LTSPISAVHRSHQSTANMAGSSSARQGLARQPAQALHSAHRPGDGLASLTGGLLRSAPCSLPGATPRSSRPNAQAVCRCAAWMSPSQRRAWQPLSSGGVRL